MDIHLYHEELKQSHPSEWWLEQGKPASEALELWSWDGAQWSVILADEILTTWRNWYAGIRPVRNMLVMHGGLQNGTNFGRNLGMG